MKKLAFLAILISLVLPWNAFAQGEYQAVISKPDLSQFPTVNAYIDAHAPDGAFLHGLDPATVQVIEDGKSLPVTSLTELRLGVQVSVVINASPSFSLRNARGVTRFDYIKQYIETWAQSQRSITNDDLNLFTNSVINQTHLKDSLAFQSAFATYQPDLKQAIPSLDPLNNAINMAIEAPQDPPSEKAILYFTPIPGDEMTDTVRLDIITRAKQSGARIFVWMIASQHQFDDPQAASLRSIADETGGQFFAFSGMEPFAEAQTLIEPLRFLYSVQYISGIRDAGDHRLAVRIDLPDSLVTSLPVTFPISLLPPNPIFVGLPAEILRTAPATSKNPLLDLAPTSQGLEILVEFPDGYRRQISSSRLLVDGAVAYENLQEPFTRFVWDLSPYTSTGKHTLQTQITDELGFSQTSALLSVDITVTLPRQSGWIEFLSGGGVYLLLAGVFIFGVVAAILTRNWRETGTLFPKSGGKSGSTSAAISIETETRSFQNQDEVKYEPQEEKFQASLVLLGRNMKPAGDPAILLDDTPVSFGSDRQRVTVWIDDETLEAVHCTIQLKPDGSYTITDHHSVLGTWLNYTAITADATPLHHGDVIQVGELSYRYEETPPRQASVVEVKPYNSKQ